MSGVVDYAINLYTIVYILSYIGKAKLMEKLCKSL